MDGEQIKSLVLLIGLTAISGIGDSHGFIHAAKMWDSGNVVSGELGKSALGFFIGISTYWVAVRYLNELGVLSPEIQTVIWFGITIVGVAVISGRFLRWQTIDQIIAAIVLLGIGWLLARTE
jgi:hypothetical protein